MILDWLVWILVCDLGIGFVFCFGIYYGLGCDFHILLFFALFFILVLVVDEEEIVSPPMKLGQREKREYE